MQYGVRLGDMRAGGLAERLGRAVDALQDHRPGAGDCAWAAKPPGTAGAAAWGHVGRLRRLVCAALTEAVVAIHMGLL